MKATELIKPEEIRVGNCLNYIDVGQPYPLPYNVDWESIKECTHNNKSFNERHKPIELTEELLLRAGLLKLGDGYEFWESSVFNIEYLRNHWHVCYVDNVLSTNIKYLHQLQNLYHALTGKELTLN